MRHTFTSGYILPFAVVILLITERSINAQSKLWGMTSSGGNQFGCVFSSVTGSTSVSDQFSLSGISGDNPEYSNLTQANDGKLYGVTYLGGVYGGGIIFQYDPATNIYTKKFDFYSGNGINPRGSLIKTTDGKLYGMTTAGGANNYGVIFQYDPSASAYTKKIDLSSANGCYPFGSLLAASNGKLYGMTNGGGINSVGVIFQYDPVTNSYAKKIDLSVENGSNPYGSLMQATNGKLYGMTNSGGSNFNGVLFQYDPVNNLYSKKVNLSADGSYPYGSLVQASNGKLYGMTSSGGFYNGGVIFLFDPLTNIYTKVVDLNGANGNSPYGSLMQASDGKLYGMTYEGGSNGVGVIFQFDPSANVYTKKIDFSAAGGDYPYGSLMQASDGQCYGMTCNGGMKDEGVIFKYSPSINYYVKEIDFSFAVNGDSPNGSLISVSDGKFYGMTRYGGLKDAGTLFQYDPVTNIYAKKIDLDSAGGDYPRGVMLQATDGKLYGMTTFGGANDVGVIFQYDPASNTYTKKISLSSANGAYPSGSLMQAADGKLYGMTYGGGANNEGVIFQYDPVTNIYAKKIDLDSAIGGNPSGSLVQAGNGYLYGMTTLGGANDCGVIFQYDPVKNLYVNKINMSSADGANAYGSLLKASDGKLYGMTYQGGVNNAGVIFQYDPAANTYYRKISLSAANGSNPYGSLQQASDGKIYGMTSAGGTNNSGVIFQYNLLNNTYIKMVDFNCVNGAKPLYGNLIEVASPININVKCLLQGYYTGMGTMTPALKNEGVSVSLTEVDTVTVSLVDSATLNVIRIVKGVLYTDGTLSVTFPGTVSGFKYYLKITHRDALETWSKYTVTMSNGLLYDFTTAADKAYGGNMTDVNNEGIWSFYSGDVNQDGGIDATDFLVMNPDIQSGKAGYLVTDVNGDGGVDGNDFLSLYPNIQTGKGTIHP